ncbi:MAG TPA: RNA polymerase sigma factor [Pseudonocardiaceae bacterium]|nr:RNA polymerase sigma factor [Pseudonocardiaceae bacterium]
MALWLSDDVIDAPRTTRAAVEAVWRIEAARLVAGLARITGDVGTAEELAQDALVAALEQWPTRGVPPNPAGWLMTTAKNRGVDLARRRHTLHRKLGAVYRDIEVRQDTADTDRDDTIDDHIGDDVLRLIFTACHPALSMESRVALTLRCVGGLASDEIARAFLVPEATAAQRIVRAKKTLRDKEIAFELPTPDQARERLATVLEVLYLIFNEGYAATSGPAWTRPELCEEALRLARVLANLVPDVAEVHGFVALVELQASRIAARTGPDGEPVLLADQDRGRWDRLLIRRGMDALQRAERLAGNGSPVGPYLLQAGIAGCHARAVRARDTDWVTIAGLYGVLRELWPNPVVELNRAVAVGMAQGPDAGLAVLDAVAGDPVLRGYAHLPAVRAELLTRAGRGVEAREQWCKAAELTRNEGERWVFSRRAGQVS